MKTVSLTLGLGFLGNVAAAVLPRDTSSTSLAPAGYEWQTPETTDRRSPCPMLNSLANHGFLPRNGQNISAEQVYWAFDVSLHWIHDSVFDGLVAKALSTSTTGNASTFNLDDTVKHDVLEHDGSLSRGDTYFGDALSFNQTIWAEVAAWFTSDTIDITTAAKARAARVVTAALVNPIFSIPAAVASNGYFETALYLVTFGQKLVGNAPTSYIKALFGQYSPFFRPSAPVD